MPINLARVYSAELEGIDARIIEVEADINVGIHNFNIVGLADRSLNEARERVNSALKNSGIKPPNRENRRITINLAPADFRKTGSHYDLAIALSYLCASRQMREFRAENKIFLGELALDGRLRPVNGALNIAQKAAEEGFEYLFVPKENANEASVIEKIKIIPVQTFREVIKILEKRTEVIPSRYKGEGGKGTATADLSEIKGQELAKRALLIAAAGNHNLLLVGPPGIGKSFLARALPGILPELNLSEAIETTKIWSAAGIHRGGLIKERPFRSPHQTSSVSAMLGGGPEPKPGEISLAHNGVLFLDELPEFQRNILEALRGPLEEGSIRVARSKKNFLFPAKFSLIAAMNPCPCGFYGDTEKDCKCSALEIVKYQKKVSGPLLDRIDMRIRLGRVKIEDLQKRRSGPLLSPLLREKVERARGAQQQRFSLSCSASTNSKMPLRSVDETARLDSEAEKFIAALARGPLSPRGYYRLLKVARTIADLEMKECVSKENLAEAYSYRIKEEL